MTMPTIFGRGRSAIEIPRARFGRLSKYPRGERVSDFLGGYPPLARGSFRPAARRVSGCERHLFQHRLPKGRQGPENTPKTAAADRDGRRHPREAITPQKRSQEALDRPCNSRPATSTIPSPSDQCKRSCWWGGGVVAAGGDEQVDSSYACDSIATWSWHCQITER